MNARSPGKKKVEESPSKRKRFDALNSVETLLVGAWDLTAMAALRGDVPADEAIAIGAALEKAVAEVQLRREVGF